MAGSSAPTLPSGVAMSRTPLTHHRPKVNKGILGVFWYSTCPCGHVKHHITWHRAFIDALIHSEELR